MTEKVVRVENSNLASTIQTDSTSSLKIPREQSNAAPQTKFLASPGNPQPPPPTKLALAKNLTFPAADVVDPGRAAAVKRPHHSTSGSGSTKKARIEPPPPPPSEMEGQQQRPAARPREENEGMKVVLPSEMLECIINVKQVT